MSALSKIEMVRVIAILADASRQAMLDPSIDAAARGVATDQYLRRVDHLMDHLTEMLGDGSMMALIRLAALEGKS